MNLHSSQYSSDVLTRIAADLKKFIRKNHPDAKISKGYVLSIGSEGWVALRVYFTKPDGEYDFDTTVL